MGKEDELGLFSRERVQSMDDDEFERYIESIQEMLRPLNGKLTAIEGQTICLHILELVKRRIDQLENQRMKKGLRDKKKRGLLVVGRAVAAKYTEYGLVLQAKVN